MDPHGKLCESPLKAPAVEVVDLLSSDESAGDELDANDSRENAWEDVPEDESANDEDDILSFYEDALDAMDGEDENDSDSGGKKTTPFWLLLRLAHIPANFSQRRRGSMHPRRIPCLPQKVTTDWARSIYKGNRRSSDDYREEIVHGIRDSTPCVFGRSTRYCLLPSTKSLHCSRTVETKKASAIQHGRRCGVPTKGIEEYHRPHRRRGQSFPLKISLVHTDRPFKISTSLGIPDFRSKDTGLYSQLQHLGLNDPQEVFDISIFREDPSIFYSVAKDILPSTDKYSPTHAFIRLLQERGKLLTNFTQNIDNLEGHAGILPEKLIQCHGSFATASCVECKYNVKGEEIYKDLKAGRVARCDRCIRHIRQSTPAGIKRKRSSNGLPKGKKKRQEYEDSTDDEDYDIAVAGVMKVRAFFPQNCL